MGRFVRTINSNWEWKYSFAEQCSNFGWYAEGYECFRVYRGDDGEFVRVFGEKSEVLRDLDELIDSLRQLDSHTCCNSEKCLEHTVEMFEDFRKFITECAHEYIDLLMFSEYA